LIRLEKEDQSPAEEDWWGFLESHWKPVESTRNGEGNTPAPTVSPEQWNAMWVDLKAIKKQIPVVGAVSTFKRWAGEVARYSFQAGSILLDGAMEMQLADTEPLHTREAQNGGGADGEAPTT